MRVNHDESVSRLRGLIESCGNIVFFGGAGVSTESGIPDFRSESGIYNVKREYGVPPETLLSRSYFMSHTEHFYEYYKNDFIVRGVEPNKAHHALARLEKQGKLKAVITQNIDNLHQAAGSKNVLELHGSAHRNYCVSCNAFYSLDYVMVSEGVPKCGKCGGIVKPDVVLYEEPLDGDVMEESVRRIRECGLLIVGGTSLAVYPAAGLLRYFRGNALVIINRDATPADERAALCIRGSIGEALDSAVGN